MTSPDETQTATTPKRALVAEGTIAIMYDERAAPSGCMRSSSTGTVALVNTCVRLRAKGPAVLLRAAFSVCPTTPTLWPAATRRRMCTLKRPTGIDADRKFLS